MPSGTNIENRRLDAKAQVVMAKISLISVLLDLSGAAQVSYLIHALRNYIVKAITFTYVEASSADAGVAVIVGKESDDNYYAAETSEVSKSAWDEVVITILNTDLAKGDTLYVSNAGGKTGTGTVLVTVELLPKLDNYD